MSDPLRVFGSTSGLSSVKPSGELTLFNSLGRRLQPLRPLEPGHVRMYVCGMTVYDDCHLGHARVMVVFDLLQRWLKALGYRVTYVRNITDIDDKIIRRAVEQGQSMRALTDHYIQRMHEDADALGVQRPDHEPRATEYITPMVGMITSLLNQNIAYRSEEGDVNYSVRAFPHYGKLSGKSLDDLRAGERVVVRDDKRDPLDFVLWKAAKPDEPADAVWQTSLGPGRPGWHIECSAMSCSLLGESFDIHGGGADLQFPHHENEIAQSEAVSRKPLASVWMHNGFVRVVNAQGEDEKMSKSKQNFFTIRTLLERYDAEVVRFFILRAHYRSPLNYSTQHLDDARQALTRLYGALRVMGDLAADGASGGAIDEVLAKADSLSAPWLQRFITAMNQDLATPEAVAVLFDLAAEIYRLQAVPASQPDALQLATLLRRLGGWLGILQRSPQAFFQAVPASAESNGSELDPASIEQAIHDRREAKQNRDFARADEIRQSLLAQGVVLEDAPGGVTTWRRGK